VDDCRIRRPPLRIHNVLTTQELFSSFFFLVSFFLLISGCSVRKHLMLATDERSHLHFDLRL
jgi:hypothetical protein